MTFDPETSCWTFAGGCASLYPPFPCPQAIHVDPADASHMCMSGVRQHRPCGLQRAKVHFSRLSGTSSHRSQLLSHHVCYTIRESAPPSPPPSPLKLVLLVSPVQDFDFLHHRPNIVSTIISRSDQLSKSSQLFSQHDEVRIEGGKLVCVAVSPPDLSQLYYSQILPLLSLPPSLPPPLPQTLRCTYFLAEVDSRVTFVVISASRVREKDTKTASVMAGE